MKNIRKIVCVAIAVMTLFVCANVAFAVGSNMSYWNSGTCYHLFTTDGAATKDSGSWKQFLIHPHMAFSQTVEEVCLNARPKTLTGYYLSDPVEVYAVSAGESTYLAIKVTSNSSRNNIHMQIINPYYESGGSGPNMESSGKFFGEY